MKAKFKTGLEKKPANFAPLSPVSFVRRSAEAYPDAPAIIFDEQVWSWRDVFVRCRKIAGALRSAGLTADSTVAVLCRNIPAAVELSYAVPMSRSVLNMINTRLDAAAIAFILEHGEAEVFFVDSALADIAQEALAKISADPIVVCIPDSQNAGAVPGGENYEDFIEKGEPVAVDDIWPANEWDAITLNYTSGTTGNPKGVVSHHRGAYLNGLGEALEWSMPMHARYLWTLPLFHCNGWCFPWTLAARAGVNVCMRAPEPSLAVELIRRHHVSHLCGAPIVLNMLITELSTQGEKLDPAVEMMTAGAAPPPAVLQAAESVGFDVTHVYGLTEVYGPTAICAWREEWDTLPPMQRAAYRARQGVNYTVLEELSARDPETLREVPPDGETIGEIMFRGNVVMKGYLKNDKATKEAFRGGHFHSGDLGVRHADGHIEIRDRSKDIIISGGENISSIEVEGVLHQHPAVAAAAVVAAPHEKWGETPAAFIELRQGACVGEDEIIAFCRENMAHFKCPTMVSFVDLPKTATGKIQKFVLRRMIAELQSGSVAKLSGIKEGGSVGKNA